MFSRPPPFEEPLRSSLRIIFSWRFLILFFSLSFLLKVSCDFAICIIEIKRISDQGPVQMEENKSHGLIGYTQHKNNEITRRQPFVQR